MDDAFLYCDEVLEAPVGRTTPIHLLPDEEAIKSMIRDFHSPVIQEDFVIPSEFMSMPFRDNHPRMADTTKEEIIASGAVGEVVCISDSMGKKIVVKKMTSDEIGADDIRLEYYIGRFISHGKYIGKSIDLVVHGQQKTRGILMHYYPYSLASFLNMLQPQGTVDGDKIRERLMLQIASGVSFMHANNVIHRDLKPNNIVVDIHGDIKIIDFGNSFHLDTMSLYCPEMNPNVCSHITRAPELLMESTNYTETVDIWAMACVFNYIWRGKNPLLCEKDDRIELLDHMINLAGPIPDKKTLDTLKKAPMFNLCYQYSEWKKRETEHTPTFMSIGMLGNVYNSMFSWEPTHRPPASKVVRTIEQRIYL